MAFPKKLLYTIAAFLIGCIGVCVVNFILQVAAIFIDVFDRHLSTSSAFIIVLWIVTGVFGAVFTFGAAESLLGKPAYSGYFTAMTIIVISVIAIVLAIVLLSKGEFNNSPSEYSLLLSNGYVFLSYFLGCGLTALIFRNLDK